MRPDAPYPVTKGFAQLFSGLCVGKRRSACEPVVVLRFAARSITDLSSSCRFVWYRIGLLHGRRYAASCFPSDPWCCSASIELVCIHSLVLTFFVSSWRSRPSSRWPSTSVIHQRLACHHFLRGHWPVRAYYRPDSCWVRKLAGVKLPERGLVVLVAGRRRSVVQSSCCLPCIL